MVAGKTKIQLELATFFRSRLYGEKLPLEKGSTLASFIYS